MLVDWRVEMLSKKNLWFLTLFSIILVMAVYYVSIPSDGITSLVSADTGTKEDVSITVKESSTITALKVSRDESLEKEVDAIKEILTSDTKTTEEKNEAYETLKFLNTNKGKEENIEKIIKEKYNYDNFVSIDGTNVKVVIDASEHSYDLANKIMSSVQAEFDKKVYITVSFGSK